MDVLQIAAAAHEINRIYCSTIGDHSQTSWNHAPHWQRESAILGVEKIKSGEIAKPSDSHMSWLKQKEADGWKYGPVKDVVKKEHPCYVPYEELPVEQQYKDYLFFNVVTLLLGMAPGEDKLPAPIFRNLRETVDRAIGVMNHFSNEVESLQAQEPPLVNTSSIYELAKRAYQTYGGVVAGKNFMGDPMPEFDELPGRIIEAWCAATRSLVTPQTVSQDAPIGPRWLLDPLMAVGGTTSPTSENTGEYPADRGEPSAADLDAVSADPSIAPGVQVEQEKVPE